MMTASIGLRPRRLARPPHGSAFGADFSKNLPLGALHRAPAGVDDEIGDLAIERVAHQQENHETRTEKDRQQKEAISVLGGAGEELVDGRVEIDHETTRVQVRALLRVQHHASAGGKHDVFTLRQVVDDLFFALAKTRLALDGEDLRNVRAGARLDFMIAVDELAAERFRELPTDGRLARAHLADEDEVGGFGDAASSRSV